MGREGGMGRKGRGGRGEEGRVVEWRGGEERRGEERSLYPAFTRIYNCLLVTV